MTLVFYGVPLALAAFFLISLCRYISAKRRNEAAPGSFTDEQMLRRKTLLTTSLTLLVILLVVVVALSALMFLAIAFM